MAGINQADSARIYHGMVQHQRLRPFRHRLRYRVFNFYLDLAALTEVAHSSRWFSYNRFNLFSFYDRDHGPRDGSPALSWAHFHAAKAGIDITGGKVYLLCLPRVLGYVFNPISIYFLHAAGGELRGVIYQVRNTFGGMHSYCIKLDDASPPLRHRAEKAFHVSPFMPMAGEYHFRLIPPGERYELLIQQYVDAALTLTASQIATPEGFTDQSLWRCFWRYPLLTLKVIGGIHYEAIKIFFRKNSKFYRSPPPPPLEMCYYRVLGNTCEKMDI
jgi:DUF1365 family protein